jgi:hypothetical protein
MTWQPSVKPTAAPPRGLDEDASRSPRQQVFVRSVKQLRCPIRRHDQERPGAPRRYPASLAAFACDFVILHADLYGRSQKILAAFLIGLSDAPSSGRFWGSPGRAPVTGHDGHELCRAAVQARTAFRNPSFCSVIGSCAPTVAFWLQPPHSHVGSLTPMQSSGIRSRRTDDARRWERPFRRQSSASCIVLETLKLQNSNGPSTVPPGRTTSSDNAADRSGIPDAAGIGYFPRVGYRSEWPAILCAAAPRRQDQTLGRNFQL